MGFKDLSPELSTMIATYLGPKDLESLMCTTSWLAESLTWDHDSRAILRSFPDSRTILHWAAEKGEKRLGQRVLNRGIPASCLDTHQMSPLHLAAKSGHAGFVELLLRTGAEIDAFDKWGKTPLWLAAVYHHPKVVRILIEGGADATVSKEGPCPFTIVRAVVASFLANSCEDDLKNVFYMLMHASPNRSKRCVPDQDFVEEGIRQSVLHKLESLIDFFLAYCPPVLGLLPFAAQSVNLPIFRRLAGSDTEILLEKGLLDDCLIYAVKFNNPEVVKFLLSAGANPSARVPVPVYPMESTPLHEAVVLRDKGELARALIAAGAELNVKCSRKLTPIFWAITAFDDEQDMALVFETLINAGANPLETCPLGGNLLHYICSWPGREIIEFKVKKWKEEYVLFVIRLLVRHGVDVNKTNKHGITPLHHAISSWSLSIIKSLIEAGANPRFTNCGKTITCIAKDRIRLARRKLTSEEYNQSVEVIEWSKKLEAEPALGG